MLRKPLVRLLAAGIVICGSAYAALNTEMWDVAVFSWAAAACGLVLAGHALAGRFFTDATGPEH